MKNKKLENIIKKLEENNFDGMILLNFNNIKYVSNYYPSSFALCVLKKNPIIFVSKMDMELAKKKSSMDLMEFESFSQINDFFKENNLKNLAIERNLTIGMFKKLEKYVNLNIVDFIEKERMIKTPEEINNLEKAVNIAHKSIKELEILNKYDRGISEWELSYELGYLMRENGAEEESFETIIATGSNSSLPHAKTSKNQLKTPILIDWGCKFKGYCSDTSRTLVFNEKQEEIFEIVLEAYNFAIKSVKSGIIASNIDKIARSIISDYGYGKNFIHSTGHSLGLDIHELPSISEKDETILEKNMVITIEPGIYIENNFGVRIEDMIIVKKNKGEIIGNLPYYL